MPWMLLPPKSGGISMTFTAAFCMKTIFEMASIQNESLPQQGEFGGSCSISTLRSYPKDSSEVRPPKENNGDAICLHDEKFLRKNRKAQVWGDGFLLERLCGTGDLCPKSGTMSHRNFWHEIIFSLAGFVAFTIYA